MANKNSNLLFFIFLSAVLTLNQLQMAQAASTSETGVGPAVGETPTQPAESEQPPEREGPTFREGPVPGTPFSPVTSPGDPFGLLPESGLAAGIPLGAAGFRLGPVTIFPALGVGYVYDDNYFGAAAGRQSTSSIVFSPLIRAELRPPGGHLYSLTYSADIGRNFDSSADSYTRQRVSLDSNVIITTRARLNVQAQHLETFERRGSVAGVLRPEPDKRADTGLAGIFTYGVPGAQGRIDLEAGHQSSKYKNNLAATSPFSHDTVFVGGAFYWRIMPKTSLLFRTRHSEIDYPTSSIANLDSSERQYSIGVVWEATAQTTGTFSVGQLRKEFDTPTRQGFTGLFWQGTTTWAPRTYSIFELSTAQHTSESTGVGDFALSRVIFLNWTHSWTDRISTRVRSGYRTDDYRGVGVTRKDDATNIGAGVTYRFRRWLNFGANYDHFRQSSNTPFGGGDRNVVSVTVAATL